MQSGGGALTFTSSGDLGQANVYSHWIYKGAQSMGSIQLSYTGGSCVGTFGLQTSCDWGGDAQHVQRPVATAPTLGDAAITHVDDLTGSTTASLDVATTQSVTLRYVDVPDPWIRVKWTRTSGSGTTVTGRTVVMGAK
jgi:hypothetical protein